MNIKTLPSVRSTGGAGHHFETKVLAYLAVLMLARGYFHFSHPWRIEELQPQTNRKGYETDDLAVIFTNPESGRKKKLLIEIKSSIACRKSHKGFRSAIKNAWIDFNDAKKFAKGTDSIMLVTGLLSAADHAALGPFLSGPKNKKDYDEFCEEKGNLSQLKQKKQKVIEQILRAEDSERELSREDIYGFYNHFFVCSLDLDYEEALGPLESTLLTLISKCQPERPLQLWAEIFMKMQSSKTRGKTITIDSFSDDIRRAFGQDGDTDRLLKPVANYRPVYSEAEEGSLDPLSESDAYLQEPELEEEEIRNFLRQRSVRGYFPERKTPSATNELQAEELAFLARTVLIGAWDDQNKNDQAIVSELLQLDGDYLSCKRQAHNILSACRQKLKKESDAPKVELTHKGDIWRVENRAKVWEEMGAYLISSDIRIFEHCAIKVLKENDPDSDFSSRSGHWGNYSEALRRGLAEGLAILGSNPDVLEDCVPNLGKRASETAVQNILAGADASLWRSLNDLLPTLAEAAPHVFMEMVEKSLCRSSSPLGKLLEQEEKEECELIDHGYITGTIWAMECMAWDEKYLVRVCMALGKMANFGVDDGQWIAAPFNSLINILMPWLPQTKASQQKREAAAKTILRDFPDIALDLFPLFLPGSNRMVSDIYMPRWRNAVPENRNLEVKVFIKDYQKEVSFYSDLIIKSVNGDASRFSTVVDKVSQMPEEKFNQLIGSLKISSFADLSEKERLPLWLKLVRFNDEHRHYKESKPAVGRIEEVAKTLAPKSDFYLHQKLFDGSDFDPSDKKGSYREQLDRLYKKQELAIKKIFKKYGFNGVLQFSDEEVSVPFVVGRAFGSINNKDIDQNIFPDFLEDPNIRRQELARGFIVRKFSVEDDGWKWFGAIDKSGWTSAQIGCFLAHLRFNNKTWDQVSKWLKGDEREYWSRVGERSVAYPQTGEKNLSYGVEMLIKHDNAIVSLRLLRDMLYGDWSVDIDLYVQTLLCLVDSDVKVGNGGSSILNEVIRHVHRSGDSVNKEDALKIEWYFMRSVNFYPKYHAMEMADDPEFFCKIVQRANPSNERETHEDADGILISNSWELLREWKDFPGTSESGKKVKVELLKDWLKRARKICEDKKYRKAALHYIGRVLAHVPADLSGLWINRSVAEILNEAGDNGDLMRSGFANGLSGLDNSPIVDPTGERERKLAKGYRKQADEVENAGFELLAKSLREMADQLNEND